ncbi:MAG: DUF4199 domain-containing protein [Taibaiella sp.]|nr:DUF4199 domain-containing protein [Taibaiella sp.]
MKRIVLVFSLIAGIITAGMLFITMPLAKNGILEPSALLGYGTMVLALSVIFPAIKSYRDKQQNGVITFAKAFLIGIYISLISSAIYAMGWEIYISTTGMTAVEFMNSIYEKQVTAMKEAGATAEELAMYQIGDWYNNFLPRYLFTMLGEMFPVGLIISLICAGILKRKTAKTA